MTDVKTKTDAKTKLARWQRLQQLADDARYELADLIKPILAPMGFKGGRITEVDVSRDRVTFHYTVYFRNESFPTELWIPREVWDAPDPVSAAEAWAKANPGHRPRER